MGGERYLMHMRERASVERVEGREWRGECAETSIIRIN
jgi:hypothetical protein